MRRRKDLERAVVLDSTDPLVLAAAAAAEATPPRRGVPIQQHVPRRQRRHASICIDFDSRRKGKRGAVSDPYQGFSKEQVAECQELFCLFDKNNDRTIDFMEFVQMMRAMGLSFTELELEKFFRETDKDGDGNIQFEELLHCLKNISQPLTKEEEMLEAFKFFSCNDGSGGISKHALAKVLMHMGETVSAEDCGDMIEAVCGHDLLDYSTFDHLVKKEEHRHRSGCGLEASGTGRGLNAAQVSLPSPNGRSRTTSNMVGRSLTGSSSVPSLTRVRIETSPV